MTAIRRRHLLGGLGAAALSLPRVALAQTQGQPAEQRIGALFPLSGPLALLGDESFRGVELAVEECNAAGGLWSRPIRLLRADAPDEAAATSEVRRLIQERAVAVFGTFASPLALAATQVTELQNLPYFELVAPADALTERGFRNLYRSCPRASDLAAAAIGAVEPLAAAEGRAERSLRLAILHDEGADAQSIAALQEQQAQARGLSLVGRFAHGGRAVELASVVQRLRAGEAELLLHCPAQGEGLSDVVALFRAFQEAGWWPRMVLGIGGAYGLVDTAHAVGAAFEGVLRVDVPMGDVNERFAPGASMFREAYKRRYGMDPRAGQSLAAWFGARVFLEAMQRAGAPDRDRIRAAVLATDLAEGTTPAGWGARFDERGQNQRARPCLVQWQGDRQVVVAPGLAAAAALRPRLGKS